MLKQKKLSIFSLKASILIILTFFLIILYFYFSSSFQINNASKAYITNQGDNTVSIIDLETLKTLKCNIPFAFFLVFIILTIINQ